MHPSAALHRLMGEEALEAVQTITFFGDINEDSALTVADIDELNLQIGSGTVDDRFDLNRDGMLNERDRDYLVEDYLQTFYGDANLDRQVDAADLNSLALNWRGSDAVWADGDFTGDGEVNALDLNILALNWRATGVAKRITVQHVPEPSALLLAVLGLTAACRLFRVARA